MVAMLPLSLRSNAGSFEPSLMPTSSCGRNSLKSVMRRKCHIYWRLVICIMPLNLEQLQCMPVKPYMPSAKAVKPRKTSHKSLLHSASTAPIHTPGHDNCPVQNAICKRCSKKGHWYAKCHSSGTAGQQLTESNGAEKASHH